MTDPLTLLIVAGGCFLCGGVFAVFGLSAVMLSSQISQREEEWLRRSH